MFAWCRVYFTNIQVFVGHIALGEIKNLKTSYMGYCSTQGPTLNLMTSVTSSSLNEASLDDTSIICIIKAFSDMRKEGMG